ncbi:MAG TPA: hypothetical protein VK168_18485 [Saprospiraceae bacterium]|nr:hypothetical protein [Saprospiraceae bacterium]
MQYTKWKWVAKAIVFGAAFVGLGTYVTMLLWNNLAVGVFGLPVLGFFQTLGLMVLGRLLTGGWGWRSWRGGGSHKGHWMRKRWHSMTPEQREQFMQRWKA